MFAKKLAKTTLFLGMFGLTFYSGYYVKSHYASRIGERVVTELNDRLPENIQRENVEYYKNLILAHPKEYKKDILDITMFGVKNYHTDVFLRSVQDGARYIDDKVDDIRRGTDGP